MMQPSDIGMIVIDLDGTVLGNGPIDQRDIDAVNAAMDRGIEVVEDAITRDELYVADEVFLTGTAAEVTPVREIDHREIGTGRRGPVTETLQRAFFEVVSGRDNRHQEWLDYL